MKKTFRFVLAAFAIVAAASCAQELEGPVTDIQQDVELVPLTISVAGEMTKTTVGEDGKTINWCADDKIAVFDGVAKREFTIVDGTANGKTASFQGLVAKDAVDFHAVYPYESAVAQADGLVTVNAVSEQVLDGGNVADGAILAVTSFKKGAEALSFSNAVGFLRVDVSYEDVTEVIVCGTGIAGTASFNAAGELEALTAGESTVSLLPAGEVFAPGSYYVTLLPGTTPAGAFTVTLVRKGDTGVVMTAAKEVAVPRNAGFFVADTKLSETFIIKDAATLQTFLSGAKDYQAGQSATVVKDIDLAGVELASAESFAGVLNGNGRSLKNWTSAGVSLFTEVSGSVNYLTLDASCSLAPADAAGAFGFVAETVAAGGAVNGCVNNADITFAPAQWAAAGTQEAAGVFFGTIVGQNNGSVHGCVNNGDLNITAATSTAVAERGWVYLGGVVGRMDNATQIAADATFTGLSDCVNNGDLTYTVDGMSGYVFIGGVTGGTAAAKISTTTTVKGNVSGCINTGNVSYTFDNGGDMEDGVAHAATDLKSNYANVAGVVGYCEGSVTACVNGVKGDVTKGKVDFIAPVVKVDYSASRASVAGVTGYVFQNIDDCVNHGAVTVKGTFNKGGNYAGVGKVQAVTVAGVVGQTGAYSKGENFHVKNCHNYGPMDVSFLMAPDEQTIHYVGGVVGYAYSNIETCTNEGAVKILSSGKENYFGGVAGTGLYENKDLSNNGKIDFILKRLALVSGSTNNCLNSANNCFGGVIGMSSNTSNDKVLYNAVNNADVTYTVLNECTKTLGTQFKAAGVVGYAYQVDGATNNGKVTINECVNASTPRWGGVAGGIYSSGGGVANATNNGEVSYKGVSAQDLYVGGVAGYIDVKATGLKNTANVTVDVPEITSELFMGGVAGAADLTGDFANSSNSGKVQTNAGKDVYIAGVIGKATDGATKFIKTVNTGDVIFNVGAVKVTNVRAAGICGYSYNNSTFDACENSGSISISAAGASDGFIGGIAGGVSGNSNSVNVEGCKNTGNLTVACPALWYAGGILGHGGDWSSSNQRTMKDNVASCDITLGTTVGAHFVGGIVGLEGRNADISGNSYTGTITVGKNDSAMGHVGGLVGSTHLNASSESSSAPVTYNISSNVVDADMVFDAADYYGLISGGSYNKKSSVTSVPNVNYVLGTNTIKTTSSLNGAAVTATDLLVGTRNDGKFTNVVTGTENVIFQ